MAELVSGPGDDAMRMLQAYQDALNRLHGAPAAPAARETTVRRRVVYGHQAARLYYGLPSGADADLLRSMGIEPW